jgi:hypothetical protein
VREQEKHRKKRERIIREEGERRKDSKNTEGEEEHKSKGGRERI